MPYGRGRRTTSGRRRLGRGRRASVRRVSFAKSKTAGRIRNPRASRLGSGQLQRSRAPVSIGTDLAIAPPKYREYLGGTARIYGTELMALYYGDKGKVVSANTFMYFDDPAKTAGNGLLTYTFQVPALKGDATDLGQMHFETPIHPYLLCGGKSHLWSHARRYNKFRFNSVKVTYVPQVSSGEVGTCLIGASGNTQAICGTNAIQLEESSPQTVAEYLRCEPGTTGSIWTPQSLYKKFNVRDEDDYFGMNVPEALALNKDGTNFRENYLNTYGQNMDNQAETSSSRNEWLSAVRDTIQGAIYTGATSLVPGAAVPASTTPAVAAHYAAKPLGFFLVTYDLMMKNKTFDDIAQPMTLN